MLLYLYEVGNNLGDPSMQSHSSFTQDDSLWFKINNIKLHSRVLIKIVNPKHRCHPERNGYALEPKGLLECYYLYTKLLIT